MNELYKNSNVFRAAFIAFIVAATHAVLGAFLGVYSLHPVLTFAIFFVPIFGAAYMGARVRVQDRRPPGSDRSEAE